MSTITKTNDTIDTTKELNLKTTLNKGDLLNSSLGMISSSSSKLMETIKNYEDTPKNQTVFLLFPDERKKEEKQEQLVEEVIEALSKVLSDQAMCETTAEPSSTDDDISSESSDTDPNDLTGLQNLFLMEASVMSVEELEIKNTYQQAQQQQEIADAVMAGLTQTESKLQDELAKLVKAHQQHHHHGIFGFLEDLGKAIGNALKDIAKTVAHVVVAIVTNNPQELKNSIVELAKETGAPEIFSGIKDILQGKVLEGLAKIATAPVGHSQFAKDIQNMAEIVSDALSALALVVVAGVESYLGALTGDSKLSELSKDNIDKCNKLGMDIIENPEFQTLADVAMVIMIAAAAISGQLWLAAILTVVLIANDFGGMEYAQKAIVKVLQTIDPDMSDSLAKVIADVFIIVAVTLLTAGTGAGEAAGTGAGEAAGDVGADAAADTAVEGSTDAAADEASESFTQKLSNLLKRIVEFAQQPVISRGLMGFGMTLGQSSIVEDSFAEFDKNDKKLEQIFLIIQQAVAIVVTFAGGAAGTVGSASSLGENAESLSKLATSLQAAAMLIQGGVQVGNGVLDLVVGKMLKVIAELNGNNSVFDATAQSNQAQTKQNNKHLQEIMNQFDQIIETFDAWALSGQGIANAINQNV